MDLGDNRRVDNRDGGEHFMEMLIRQSRIWADSLEDAIKQIREKYGDGKLSIREANIQPQKELIWYEFYIEV